MFGGAPQTNFFLFLVHSPVWFHQDLAGEIIEPTQTSLRDPPLKLQTAQKFLCVLRTVARLPHKKGQETKIATADI